MYEDTFYIEKRKLRNGTFDNNLVSGKIYEIHISLSVNFIQKDFNVLQYFNDYVKNEKNFGLWKYMS